MKITRTMNILMLKLMTTAGTFSAKKSSQTVKECECGQHATVATRGECFNHQWEEVKILWQEYFSSLQKFFNFAECLVSVFGTMWSWHIFVIIRLQFYTKHLFLPLVASNLQSALFNSVSKLNWVLYRYIGRIRLGLWFISASYN